LGDDQRSDPPRSRAGTRLQEQHRRQSCSLASRVAGSRGRAPPGATTPTADRPEPVAPARRLVQMAHAPDPLCQAWPCSGLRPTRSRGRRASSKLARADWFRFRGERWVGGWTGRQASWAVGRGTGPRGPPDQTGGFSHGENSIRHPRMGTPYDRSIRRTAATTDVSTVETARQLPPAPVQGPECAASTTRSSTAQHELRQLDWPGKRPTTLVRRRTSSSDRSRRFVERNRLRRRGR